MKTATTLPLFVAILAVVALGAPAGAAALNLTHTFDADEQFWSFRGGANDNVAAFSDVMGNPAGSITGTDIQVDDPPGNPAQFRAAVAFWGDYTPNIGGSISFDLATNGTIAPRTTALKLEDTDLVPQRFLVRQFVPLDDGGAATFARYQAALVPGSWELCVVPEFPPCPIASASEFASVLADVGDVRVFVDIGIGTGEEYFLDNFSVAEPPPAAPAIALPLGAPLPPTPATPTKKCPKGKKLVLKKGKRKCKKRRK